MICSKSFTRRFCYNRHVRQVHRVTSSENTSKNFRCYNCDEKFSEVDSLITHVNQEISFSNFFIRDECINGSFIRDTNTKSDCNYSILNLKNSHLIRDILRVIKSKLSLHPVYKIGLIVVAKFEQDSKVEISGKKPAEFPFRSRYSIVQRLSDAALQADINNHLSQIEDREESVLLTSSGWSYIDIQRVDVEFVRIAGLNFY